MALVSRWCFLVLQGVISAGVREHRLDIGDRLLTVFEKLADGVFRHRPLRAPKVPVVPIELLAVDENDPELFASLVIIRKLLKADLVLSHHASSVCSAP